MKINIVKPVLQVGDVIMTAGGNPYMVGKNNHGYFMMDLLTGESTSEYNSLKALTRVLICKTDTKVDVTLNIEY